MQFEKRNFMGVELDVLTGHPEHDLLFMGTQAATAAGLKNARVAVPKFIGRHSPEALKLGELEGNQKVPLNVPKRADTRRWQTIWMVPESTLHLMLLRGNSPQTEPFRKWVTEEVLPTIRKTGKYDAEQSTNPVAQSVMDELKTLRGEVSELKTLLEALVSRPLVMESAPTVSMYLDAEVHTERVWRHFNRTLLIELCELKSLSTPIADKLKPAVLLNLEVAMLALWNSTDHRKLKTELSATQKRPWALFPLDFLKKNMNREAYTVALEKTLNEKLSK